MSDLAQYGNLVIQQASGARVRAPEPSDNQVWVTDLTTGNGGSFTTTPVAAGGTGATTLTIHGVLLGQTTGAIVATAAGTAGQMFLSGGASADGAYTSMSGDGTLSSSGALAIGTQKITYAKSQIFISPERTATGSPETVAHGLPAAPSFVFCIPTDTSPATAGVFTVTEGTHTSTNVVVTVTTNKKFKIFAIV